MVKKETLLISLAAMCHDVGKFVQGCFDVPKDWIENNQSLYQPVYKGRYSHAHALYSVAFFEFNKENFPDVLFSSELGEDNFLNLVGMHHKPETPKQWIIAVADRLSSGFDRDEFLEGEEIPIKEFKSTRLVPIFEQISIDEKKEFLSMSDFNWCYPLDTISSKSIFPKLKEEIVRDLEDYERLYEKFIKAIKNLAHKDQDLFLWMQHFDSIFRKYTSFIPAARVGKVIPDVSLYDHSRTTASIATALYLFHKNSGSLDEKNIKGDGEKFLIIAGDFFGIQKFIFARGGEEAHHRSKLLRGRSFVVSLFCELACEMICDKLGLSPYSVLLNSAGKFYILAPNLPECIDKVKAIEEKINTWLIKMSYGETNLGLSFTRAKVSDFTAKRFSHLWQTVQQNLQEKKFNPFDPKHSCGVFNSYLDEFRNDLESPLCPLCGKRPSSEKVEGDKLIYPEGEGSSCIFCRDHIMLGTNLVKSDKIAVIQKSEDISFYKLNKRILEPIFGEYIVAFVKDEMNELAKKGVLKRFWSIRLQDGEIPEKICYFPLNGYVPTYSEEDMQDERLLLGRKSEKTALSLIDAIKEKEPKTFSHIALSSLEKDTAGRWLGVDSLGILKADVDDLGLIFGCGLPESRFTISRLYALSTQLNYFFSLYIPFILEKEEKFNDVYTVFAGGDDLFLIGAWNRIIELSLYLQKKFSEYVCKNNEIHFSAGITMVKSNVPIDIISTQAEQSLEKAKDAGKNCIFIFEQIVKWKDFEKLLIEKNKLYELIDKNIISKSMLYKLNEIVKMSESELKILEQDSSYTLKDISVLKWRSFLTYLSARNLRVQQKSELDDILIYFVKNIQKYRGNFKIPLWFLLYSLRQYK